MRETLLSQAIARQQSLAHLLRPYRLLALACFAWLAVVLIVPANTFRGLPLGNAFKVLGFIVPTVGVPLFCVAMLLSWGQNRSTVARLRRSLAAPLQIVWYYVRVIHVVGRGVGRYYHLVVATEDGTEGTVIVSGFTPAEHDVMLGELHAMAPQATAGFSAEAAAAFRSDPRSLRR